MPRLTRAVAPFVAALLLPGLARAQPCAGAGPDERCARGAAALGPLVAGLGVSARVLVVGAHPDDEPTPLLAYLARGRHARVAYLSLTRGEGGQNLAGAESGLALGVLRTAEVLAARLVDGADQYFTRAIDFGASKSAAEVAERWGGGRDDGADAVLGDVVTVVRAFRPHVIVSVHDSAQGGAAAEDNNSGQHQLAGRLAREAYAAAADTARFRGAGTYGRPWAAAKLYGLTPSRDSGGGAATLSVNAGEYDALLGRSYAELAAESRGRQRTQGATLAPLGARRVGLRLLASRGGAGGAEGEGAPERSLFDGVDTTLARVRRAGEDALLARSLDSLPEAVRRVQAAYRPDDPSGAVAPLAALTNLAARAAALAGANPRSPAYDPDAARSLEDLWRRARSALVLAAGVAVEATAERETVARRTEADSTDTLRVDVAVHNRGAAPVRVTAVTMTGVRAGFARVGADVAPGGAWRGALAATPSVLTESWWLARTPLATLYAVGVDGRTEQERDASEESGAVRAYAQLWIDGAEALVSVPVVHRRVEPARGEVERPVAVAPGVTLRFNLAAQYARAGVRLERPIRLTVQSAYASPRRVEVELEMPPGLAADSALRRVTLAPGGVQELWFTLRGTPKPGKYEVRAVARAGGWKYGVSGATLAFDHVAPRRLYYGAATSIQAVDVTFPPRLSVGYVAGVNDAVVPKLQQLGVLVTAVDPGSLLLPGQDLSRFDAVVVGPRAYEGRPELVAANATLLAYARAGGTLVVQYGRHEMLEPGILPYPVTLAAPPQGVTREDAPVRVVDPSARVLVAPNRIAADDFGGWVVERALFMPDSFDRRYRPALEMSDPGEPPNRGGLLVAPYGRGTYVYTALTFARQLAAANPGAARLFVNLLAAGRAARDVSQADAPTGR